MAAETSPMGRLAPLLTVALATVFGLRRLDNTDTWWHLAAGRWIVENRRVPRLDPLSSTVPDHPWINVQWLFDVVIYGLHQLGGPTLLVAVSALTYGTAAALMLVNVRRHVGNATAAVLGIWAILVAQERFAIRPEMVTYLLLQVTLWLYATGRRADDRRLWLLPPVMALWANCHSLFIVGAVVIVCQMAGAVAADLPFLPRAWRTPVDAKTRRRVLTTGFAALAATLLNPFGIEGATFPLSLLGRFDRSHISSRAVGEFQPPFSGYLVNLSIGAYQALFVFSCVVVAVALVVALVRRTTVPISAGPRRAERRRTGGRPPAPAPAPANPRAPLPSLELADVAVFIGIAYLSLLARRNMALFAMGGLPCVASALALLAAALPDAWRRGMRVLEQAVAIAVVVFVLGLGWWIASNGFYRWNGDVHETGGGILPFNFPIRAAAFTKAQGLPAPWFNDLTVGAYLTWDPPLPGGVYVDPRLEVYGADFLDEHLRQLAKPAAWQEEVDRRGIQTVITFHWWANLQPLLQHLIRDARWSVVYYDQVAVVAVRSAGNEELVTRARAAFHDLYPETERMLLEPTRSWQFPISRARALEPYANLLDRMGRRDDARRLRAHLTELRSVRMFP